MLVFCRKNFCCKAKEIGLHSAEPRFINAFYSKKFNTSVKVELLYIKKGSELLQNLFDVICVFVFCRNNFYCKNRVLPLPNTEPGLINSFSYPT